MGRLRSALRAYALEVSDPAETLWHLDRKLQHFEPGEIATVLYAVFDASLDHVHISSAGHPPPVLAVPQQGSCLVDVSPDPPLGVSLNGQRSKATFDVPMGSVLCVYTDGLIERRDRPLQDGLDEVQHAVVAGEAGRVCAAV